METYKDSGIEWIGEIPKGWEVNKYKFLGSTKNGLTYTPEDITTESDGILVLRSGNIQNGQLDFNDVVFVNTSIPNNLKLQKNDILITARNGSANLVGKNILINTEIDATYGAFMMVFRANLRINPRFAQYTMNPTFDNYKTFFTTSTVNQLTANIFYNMAVPLPPLQEQAAIADFLDKRNAEIDAITAKITQQIKTLKDYRKSLITETVTKGLDKTVTYKDSGIEFIGEIPREWNLDISKNIFREHKLRNYKNLENNLLSLSYGKIVQKDIESLAGLIPESFSTYNIIQKDDIVLRLTDLQNDKRSLRTALCKEDRGIITSAYLTLRLTTNNNASYLHYLLHSYDVCKVFYNLGGGVRLGGSWSDIGKLPLLLPPLQEQAAIADYLDEKTAKIDNIIAKKEQQLEIIKEHRKSLIYEYVTGKKRVKGY